jgi:hypothetical protein
MVPDLFKPVRHASVDGSATGLDHVVHLLGLSKQQVWSLNNELPNHVSQSRCSLVTLVGKQLYEIFGAAISRDLSSLFLLGETKACYSKIRLNFGGKELGPVKRGAR